MRYGFIDNVHVRDYMDSTVMVNVDFHIDRNVLFEFMDALVSMNGEAKREPIQALLDYSAELGEAVKR